MRGDRSLAPDRNGQYKLLDKDGVKFTGSGRVDLAKHLWKPTDVTSQKCTRNGAPTGLPAGFVFSVRVP